MTHRDDVVEAGDLVKVPERVGTFFVIDVVIRDEEIAILAPTLMGAPLVNMTTGVMERIGDWKLSDCRLYKKGAGRVTT